MISVRLTSIHWGEACCKRIRIEACGLVIYDWIYLNVCWSQSELPAPVFISACSTPDLSKQDQVVTHNFSLVNPCCSGELGLCYWKFFSNKMLHYVEEYWFHADRPIGCGLILVAHCQLVYLVRFCNRKEGLRYPTIIEKYLLLFERSLVIRLHGFNEDSRLKQGLLKYWSCWSSLLPLRRKCMRLGVCYRTQHELCYMSEHRRLSKAGCIGPEQQWPSICRVMKPLQFTGFETPPVWWRHLFVHVSKHVYNIKQCLWRHERNVILWVESCFEPITYNLMLNEVRIYGLPAQTPVDGVHTWPYRRIVFSDVKMWVGVFTCMIDTV